jgi:hypothetical protein
MFVDTAYLEKAGLVLDDLLGGKPRPRPVLVKRQTPRTATAADVLHKASDSTEATVAKLRAERDAINQKRQYGWGAGDVKAWRDANPTPPRELALDDSAVGERLRQESHVRGEALAKELIAAETRLEIEQAAAQEAEACAQRRASLSDAEAKALADAITSADGG